jgi:hypothetical protein
MQKKLVLSFVLFSIIASCSTNNNLSDPDVRISNEFSLLKSSGNTVESSVAFTQVKAFIPDSNYMDYKNIKNEKFKYIKLPKNKSVISGKVILENNTDGNMNIQGFFIQGNKIAKVKKKNSKKWERFITYHVNPRSSIEISVDIKWDREGINELIFFPLDHTAPADRYNGGNLSLIRYFVSDDEMNIEEDMLTKQSFHFDSSLHEANSYFPNPTWISNNDQEVEFIIKGDKLLAKTPIYGLKLHSVPYTTEVDILLLDEKGNLSIVDHKIKVKKNEPTFIYLPSKTLAQLRESQDKSYLILLNNRGIDLLADIEALDLGLKPFSTTYQSVIEFYKEAKGE